MNVRNFRVLVKQLFYGNEIQFQISKLGKKVKGFPCKKNSKGILCKMNPGQIKGNSFVKFTVGGPQSIHMGIPL